MKRVNAEKQGFTNQLYWLNFKMTWAFVCICLALTALSGALQVDLSFCSAAVPCAFAELGVHTGFIIWKNKAENCRKYKDVNVTDTEEVVL